MDIISFGLASKVSKALKDLIGDSKLSIPSGTTAERPVLLAGDKAVRFNTDTSGLEEWNGTEWKNVSATISAVRIKGTDTAANILAMVGMVAEDLWIASDTLDGYVYDGATWINIGPLKGDTGDTGLTGDTGATGNGIDTIVRTVGDGSAGTTDEYTITFTDTTITTFSVYNGSNGLTVDHITRTVGTGAAGSTDTYTAYADVGETTELGSFNVYNGADGLLASIVGGTGVTIDNTDPANPIINVGDTLPSQIGKAGKYLKTDGTTASWESASTGNAVTTTDFVATASQTTFAVAYTIGFVDVYRNGLLLPSSDYTATNGTDIVLNVGADTNDSITVKAYDTFKVADTYTQAQVDAKDAVKADLTYVDTGLDTKQDTLVNGTNIKTVGGQSLLGAGDITLLAIGAEPADTTILKAADIGTAVLAPDGDGSGLTGIDSLPNQTGNSGGILSTNGTAASWDTRGVTFSALSNGSIDLDVASYFSYTATTNTTFSVNNVPTNPIDFVLELTNGGSFTIGWWSGITWAAGVAPSLTVTGKDVLGFYYDGTSAWRGIFLIKDVK